MKNVDVLIVGGSAAGISVAMTAKKHYPEASVALVQQEEKVPVPCGIPYVFGTLGSPDKNLIPDTAVTGNGAELILDEVTALDPKVHTVTTQTGQTIGYKKLVLATGSQPVVPPSRAGIWRMSTRSRRTSTTSTIFRIGWMRSRML